MSISLTKDYFLSPVSATQRQYEALRAHYVEGKSVAEAARGHGYSLGGYYVLMHTVGKAASSPQAFAQYFFQHKPVGRKPRPGKNQTDALIVALRKKYLSVPDIKAIVDTMELGVSETYIYHVLQAQGFARLPRRSREARAVSSGAAILEAPASTVLDFTPECFTTQNSLGVLCLWPYLERYGIDTLLANASYPQTQTLNRFSSLMSFLALKLSGVKRYSRDDVWCMDRGLGLFAGLNVLPKAAWFSSYSHRVTRPMNLALLKQLHQLWLDHNLLSETANLDFTTIPYWGDDNHLENNWSGTRHKTLGSLLAVLAQDPESGLITYGDTTIRHDHKNEVVLEFLDFYAEHARSELRYLVFDSKFTTYQNLRRLDERGIKFLTIRRRGKNIVAELDALPRSQWRRVRVHDSSGKGRLLSVLDQTVTLRDYGGTLRQVAIAGHGRIKPALILTNDFALSCTEIIRKYARRWLVEKDISQQIEFFHLNRVSSSMVIKVDFDFTMSLLANNLLRLFAQQLPGYTHLTPESLFTKFLQNSGQVTITDAEVVISLRKKRHLPALLSAMEPFQHRPSRLCAGRQLVFTGDTRS